MYGPQNGQRPDAEQQNPCGQPPAQLPHRQLLCQLLKFSVNIDRRSDQASQCKAYNKEHRINAFWHILNDCIDAKPRCRQPHGRIQCILLIFFDPFFQNASNQASCQNGTGIYNGPCHLFLPLLPVNILPVSAHAGPEMTWYFIA